ncbi:MAG: SpoIIE family protein phosphatase [Bacteroidia bacterium]|nr:SpoIIE family protein phosphatase [Bacteroidia bacterium]
MYYLKFFITFILITGCRILFAQQGIPYIRNYLPKEYGGHSQIFSICQDNRGVMYFANTPFITEYDGKNFRQIKISDRFVTIRSLTKGNDGRIYIGAENDFGYLAPDKSGNMCFYSLLNLVDTNERNFDNVWMTCMLGNKIYFSAYEKIFVYENNKITIIKPKVKFHLTFSSGKKIYTLDYGEGLKSLEGNNLKSVAGCEKFAGVSAVIDFGSDSLLIASESNLYIHDGKKISPFICEANKYLLNNRLYRMIKVSDTIFVAATLQGGIVLMNKSGKIKLIINKDTGLQSDVILSVFPDAAGNIWAGGDNGFSKIEISSPLTEFDSRNGLNGTVNNLKLYNNTIYAATDAGVFYLHKNYNGFIDRFISLDKITYQSFDLNYFNNSLIAATGGGLFEINQKNNIKKISNIVINAGAILASEIFHGIIYIGTLHGLSVMQFEKNEWKYLGNISKLNCDVRTIAETPDGDIWIGTFSQGLYKALIGEKFSLTPEIISFTEEDGLPLDWYQVINLNGKIVFGTEQGLFYYDEKKSKFFLDKSFTEDFSLPHSSIVRAEYDKNGNLVVISIGNIAINARDENGEFHLYKKPFMRNIKGEFYGLAVDNKNYIYAGGPDGAICYNSEIKKNFNIPYYALIRYVISGRDTIFMGTFFDSDNKVIINQPEHQKPIIEYKHNSLTFEFSAAYFEPESSLLYQYFLEGNDTCWSQLTTDTKASYTNLSEGSYKFRVKACNIYGDSSQESIYMFTVMPPWYRTLWAYIGYVLIFIFIFYISLKLYTRRLKAANIRLEKIVQERTIEIRKQNAEILQQKEEITAQRDQILVQNQELHLQKEEIIAQRDEIEAHRNKLSNQNIILTEQKKEITDSITYARRIQHAMLPDLTKCFIAHMRDETFIDYFVLFKPKDVVSGDFYWVSHVNEWLLFSVADCTGHGVPGGFMSMLGIAFLNDIVRKKEVTQTNHVLNQLRQYIVEALKQNGFTTNNNSSKDIQQDIQPYASTNNSSQLDTTAEAPFATSETDVSSSFATTIKDGMDIGICALNLNQNDDGSYRLLFAGAYNNLYLIPAFAKQKQELIEIKGDKMPVAIHMKMDDFTENVIHVHKGDTLYLFSDGFKDQFGGDKGRKFKASKFKELLISVCHKPMTEQKEIIDKTIVDWMSFINPDTNQMYEQTDDITVMGIKI